MKAIQTKFLYKFGRTLLLIIIPIYITALFFQFPGVDGYYRAEFGDLICGTAYRPFVYRFLTPLLVRGFSSIFSPACPLLPGASPSLRAAPISQFIVTFILLCAFLIGFFLAFRYLFTTFFRVPVVHLDVFCFIVLLGVPTFFIYHSYLYDFSTLFLFTLCLALMARQKWGLYAIFFVVACLNKETTILLTVIYFLYFLKRLPKKQFVGLLLVQLIAFTVVRAGILWAFRNNPGTSIEFHLIDHNIPYLMQPYTLFSFLSVIILAILIYYHWYEKPSFLKISSLIFFILLGTAFFFGYIEELRDYYEVYPIFVLLMIHSIARILEIEITPLWQSGHNGKEAVLSKIDNAARGDTSNRL